MSAEIPRSQRHMGDDNLKNEKCILFLPRYRETGFTLFLEPTGHRAQGVIFM